MCEFFESLDRRPNLRAFNLTDRVAVQTRLRPELLLREVACLPELPEPLAKLSDQRAWFHAGSMKFAGTKSLHSILCKCRRTSNGRHTEGAMNREVHTPALGFDIPGDARPLGTRVFAGLVELGATAMSKVNHIAHARHQPSAAMSRIRGTGRGIHFGNFIKALEAEHPLKMESPFEGSDLVSGGAWIAQQILGSTVSRSSMPDAAVAKLRWEAGADDLPLHVHDHSARFIIVLEGRGFFHVSDQSPDRFDGTAVRSIPARERDVVFFTKGLLHTFSTAEHAMTLLSVQMPYLAFDDPDQYRLPAKRWIARDNPEPTPPRVVCDPWWAIGHCGC